MIRFKIEKDGNEFHAWSPELPGCHTHGKTVSEALRNLKDAVSLYLGIGKTKKMRSINHFPNS